jgi:hypothetical protein
MVGSGAFSLNDRRVKTMNEQTQTSESENQQASDAPRRGRPPKPVTPAGIDMICYHPGDNDPVNTTVGGEVVTDREGASKIRGGVEFKANVPIAVPKSRKIKQLLPIKSPMRDENGKQMYLRDEESGEIVKDKFGKPIPLYHPGFMMPDGTMQTRHQEVEVSLVDVLRNNVRFGINGAPPAMEKKGVQKRPETAAEYRAWLIGWAMKAQGSDKAAMTARWNLEEDLRADCGMTDGEIANIFSFFESCRDLAPDTANDRRRALASVGEAA